MKDVARVHPKSSFYVHRDVDIGLLQDIYMWIVGEFGGGQLVLRVGDEVVAAVIGKKR